MAWEFVNINDFNSTTFDPSLLANVTISIDSSLYPQVVGDPIVSLGTQNTDVTGQNSEVFDTLIDEDGFKLEYCGQYWTSNHRYFRGYKVTYGTKGTNTRTAADFRPNEGDATLNCHSLAFIVDHANSKAMLYQVYQKTRDDSEIRTYILSLTRNDAQAEFLYTWVTGHPAVHWKAWTILDGNNGQYRQRLTALKDDSIENISSGNYGTQNDFIFIAPNVDMVPYARNMNFNSPVKVAWSGINWMTMELKSEQGLLTNQVKAIFKLYAATSSDTIPIYQETRYFFVGSANHFYLSFVTDDNQMIGAFLPVYYTVGSTGTPFSWGNATPSDSDKLLIWQWLQASGSPDPDPQPERPYDNGTSDNGGGGGNPTPQDDIHTPNVPALGAMVSGMFTVYCPTDAQLQQIAAYLWSDNFIDNVKKYFNSVSDNIIAFYVLPLEPDNLQTKNFKIGNLENVSITGVKYLSDRFISIDMGSIDITRRWGTYLDFSPFTKFSLYLPGVGVVALDSDDVMSPPNLDGYLSDDVGSTISLSYTIDLFTGTLVAYVYIDGQIRYQFPGRIGYSIPLTGQNYTAMGTGFVQAMAGLATTIATGGTAAPFTAGAAAAGIVNAMKPDVYRAGNLSGDASMLSLKTPMLIKTVPNVPAHEGLEDFIGGPSYKIDAIGNFSGFTQAIEAHVEGISCTSAERDEIMQLLKSGVII